MASHLQFLTLGLNLTFSIFLGCNYKRISSHAQMRLHIGHGRQKGWSGVSISLKTLAIINNS